MKISNWRVEFKHSIYKVAFEDVKYWRCYVVHREKYSSEWNGVVRKHTRLVTDNKFVASYTLEQIKEILDGTHPWIKGQYIVAYPRKSMFGGKN